MDFLPFTSLINRRAFEIISLETSQLVIRLKNEDNPENQLWSFSNNKIRCSAKDQYVLEIVFVIQMQLILIKILLPNFSGICSQSTRKMLAQAMSSSRQVWYGWVDIKDSIL